MIIHIFIVMDKKFLNKVLDQIVRETEIDYVNKRTYFPFSSFFYHYPNPILFLSTHSLSTLFSSFSKHCKDIYGLNKSEIDYVWGSFIIIITTNKKNNG